MRNTTEFYRSDTYVWVRNIMFGTGLFSRDVSEVSSLDGVDPLSVDDVETCEEYLRRAVDPDVWVWPFERHGTYDPVGCVGGSATYVYSELHVGEVEFFRREQSAWYVDEVMDVAPSDRYSDSRFNRDTVALSQARLLLLRWEALRPEGRFSCEDMPREYTAVQKLYGDMPERLRTSGGYLERLARSV